MLEHVATQIRAEIAKLTTALAAIEGIDGYLPSKPRKPAKRHGRPPGSGKKPQAATEAAKGQGKRAPRPAWTPERRRRTLAALAKVRKAKTDAEVGGKKATAVKKPMAAKKDKLSSRKAAS
jgi:hypothetical protein